MELPNSERKKVTLAALDLETVRIVCYREERREERERETSEKGSQEQEEDEWLEMVSWQDGTLCDFL